MCLGGPGVLTDAARDVGSLHAAVRRDRQGTHVRSSKCSPTEGAQHVSPMGSEWGARALLYHRAQGHIVSQARAQHVAGGWQHPRPQGIA